MKLPILLIVLFISPLISAQEIESDSISSQEIERKVQTKTIQLSPFIGLKVYSGIEVKLIPSRR